MNSRAAAPHYQLSGSTDLASELSRIGIAELRFARAQAEQSAADPDALHQCRKSIKRLRALTRLVSASGDADGNALDRGLGRIGRRLSEARDAEVLGRIANSLHDASGSRAKRRPRLPDARPDRALVATVVAELETIEPELGEFLSSTPVALVDIERCLGEGLGAAAKRMRRFMQHGRPEEAHDWRKLVQRLHNQLRLVAGLVPAASVGRLADLEQLAGHLGDYQDLSVLQAALATGLIRCKPGVRSKLRRAAKVRQRELERTALKLGRRVFRRTETAEAATPGEVDDPVAIAVAR